MPWSCTARWRMPVEVWQAHDGRALPRRRLGPARDETLDALAARKAAARAAHVRRRACAELLEDDVSVDDACSPRCSTRATRSTRTRRARRRTRRRRRSGSSTRRPTPPAARTRSTALGCSSCSSRPRPTRRWPATLAFLEPSGERHQGVERRIELGPVAAGRADRRGRQTVPFAFDAVARAAARARAARRRPAGDAGSCASRCASTTRRRSPTGLDRAAALRASLLSTHLVAHAPGSRFASPIAPGPRPPRPSRRATTSTSSRCSPAPPTTPCSAPRSCCPTTRRSRPRATATCSTRPRSRRRCCSTCSRSATRERDAIAEQDPAVRAMLGARRGRRPGGDRARCAAG